MKGRELLDLAISGGASDARLVRDDGRDSFRRVVMDSRRAEPGTLFACVAGDHVDGHDMAPSAVERGASGLICGRELEIDVPQFIVGNVRATSGIFAAALLGRPADRMKMIALTGTNGKTTTAYIVRSILRASGARVGMIGTIVYDDGSSEREADRTTPEGADLQDLLAAMAAGGAEYCVMEASSHGLDQGRLAGCRFDAMGFSNLTNDHLDYHHTMEDYFDAKRLLFTNYPRGQWRAAINADDPYGARLIGELGDRAVPFSITGRAACRAEIIGMDAAGSDLRASFEGRSIAIRSPFIGAHNAANVIEAITISRILGIDDDAIALGVRRCPQVPGRLERYRLSNGVTAFIDYAHTPDGLRSVARAVRPLTSGRLIIVWGAGGDRAKDKRPATGRIMAEEADISFITTDNPRSERPEDIAGEVFAGAREIAGEDVRVILDRSEAIASALRSARGGDVVIVAGKGPERYIQYADRKEPFSDAAAVLGWAGSNGIEVLCDA